MKPRAKRDYSEDYALIAKSQAGDKPARDRLIEKHYGFICDSVMKSTPRGLEWQEFIADGVISFMRCIDMFDLTSGNSILTLGFLAIQRDMQRTANRARVISNKCYGADASAKRKAAGDKAMKVRFAGDRNWMLDRKTGTKIIDDMDRSEQIKIANLCLNVLDRRSRDVLERRIKGQTLVKIAADLGITRERVRQIEEYAKALCRDVIGPMIDAA